MSGASFFHPQRPRRGHLRAQQERVTGAGTIQQPGYRIHLHSVRRSRMFLRPAAMGRLTQGGFNEGMTNHDMAAAPRANRAGHIRGKHEMSGLIHTVTVAAAVSSPA